LIWSQQDYSNTHLTELKHSGSDEHQKERLGIVNLLDRLLENYQERPTAYVLDELITVNDKTKYI